VRSASGDEGRDYFRGESTISHKAAVLYRPRKATFTLTFYTEIRTSTSLPTVGFAFTTTPAPKGSFQGKGKGKIHPRTGHEGPEKE
jgi:hypothetical protein